MARSKGYTLVPKPVPTRQRTSFYIHIINDFKDSGAASALVGDTDRKPVTLVQGLRKALEAAGVTDVKVIQRGTETYLIRD